MRILNASKMLERKHGYESTELGMHSSAEHACHFSFLAGRMSASGQSENDVPYVPTQNENDAQLGQSAAQLTTLLPPSRPSSPSDSSPTYLRPRTRLTNQRRPDSDAPIRCALLRSRSPHTISKR
eukprot:5178020-Pleurochrysis_carterae.AAC.2